MGEVDSPSDTGGGESSARAPGPDILVTGLHRSGTTFVGDVLRRAGLFQVFEPMNRDYGSVLVDRWKPHPDSVTRDGRAYREVADAMITRRIRWKPALQSRHAVARAAGCALGLHRRALAYQLGWLAQAWRPRRRLFKDPDLVFFADDLERRHGFQVVILVRHPCAFYASVKRLGWRFPLDELLEQRALVERHLARYAEHLAVRPRSHAEEAAILWLFVYSTLRDLLAGNPRLLLLRHEDVAERPLPTFKALCRRLGLDFDARLAARLARATGGRRVAARANRAHDLVRDARALASHWTQALDPGEVKQIRGVVEPVYGFYYPSFGRAQEPDE
jgi:hypothetical protein